MLVRMNILFHLLWILLIIVFCHADVWSFLCQWGPSCMAHGCTLYTSSLLFWLLVNCYIPIQTSTSIKWRRTPKASGRRLPDMWRTPVCLFFVYTLLSIYNILPKTLVTAACNAFIIILYFASMSKGNPLAHLHNVSNSPLSQRVNVSETDMSASRDVKEACLEHRLNQCHGTLVVTGRFD